MMFRLLLIVTVALTLAKPSLAAETVHALSQTASERSFLTGLTPMSREGRAALVDAICESVAEFGVRGPQP